MARKSTTTSSTPVLAIIDGETIDACAARLSALNTAAAYSALDAILAGADAAADADDYRGRIHRAKRAGDAARGHAAIIAGEAPANYAAVATALGLTAENGVTYTGRAYSTLREAYRMSVAHSADGVDEFIDTWTIVYGRPPQSVRDCLAWLERIGTPEEWTENTVDAYRAAKVERESAAATAAATASANRDRTKVLVKAGCVDSVDVVTPAMWASFTKGQLQDIARLATVLALTADQRSAAATAAATADAAAREAEAETGPVAAPAARRRRNVAA